MLHLARARVVRGDPCHISGKSTTLQKFPVYGSKQTSLVCTSHDLLKSQVVTIHVRDATELMHSLDAAAPSSCSEQLVEAYGDVFREFGIQNRFLRAVSSSCEEPSIPFVGVGNCFGNIWPDDPTEGLYPCTLSLCFIDSLSRGSAILMGSVHSMESLDDVPYLTVCVYVLFSLVFSVSLCHIYRHLLHQVAPSFGKGAGSYALRDVPPRCLVEHRQMISIDKMQKDDATDTCIGNRHENDFVTWDLDGKGYATEKYDPRCVVCSANELLPREAHSKASGRQLELSHITVDDKQVTMLTLTNGHKWLSAGQPFDVDSYGGLRNNTHRESYRWQKSCEDLYRGENYTLWHDSKKDTWSAYRVQTGPVPTDDQQQSLDPCRHNDGEEVLVRFKNGTTSSVSNHIEDIGDCLKSWVIEVNPACINSNEVLLDAILSTAELHEGETQQASAASMAVARTPRGKRKRDEVFFSLSPVSESMNSLMSSAIPSFPSSPI